MSLYIVTGGASCGKTTVIKGLEQRGYTVNHELARIVLDERKSRGLTTNPNDDEKDFTNFEIELYSRQLEIERKISISERPTFGDRGSPDILAYCKHFLGRIPQEIDLFKLPRYDGIFVLEMLPFERDGVRLEKSQDEVLRIHETLIRTYELLGYQPITVPIAKSKDHALTERVDFILERVGEKSLQTIVQ